MNSCGNILRQTGKVFFFFTIFIGIILFIGCFIRCPLNLKKLYGAIEVNYKYVLYGLTGFASWILLLACGLCLWRKNELCLWYYNNTVEHSENTEEEHEIEPYSDEKHGIENAGLNTVKSLEYIV